MKKLTTILFLLSTTSLTVAQQPQQEFVIKFVAAEIDIVGKALGKMPYEDVAVLMQKIRQQIVDQQKPVEKSDSEKK